MTVPSRYSLVLATDPSEVRAAQALRYDVFAGELAARLHSPDQGLDVDPLDAYCDHILVHDDRTGQAVGTYRMLRPERAEAAGRCYSETEFDLSALAPIRGSMVELGRSCVHPYHRSGAVIGLMWAGIHRYMVLTGNRWLAGCASVPLADGGATAAGVWDRVRTRHLAPPEYQVAPYARWQDAGIVRPRRLQMPPLLRGYLRLRAWVCGPPAYDVDWNVADLFVLLAIDRIHPRYQRHFLGLEATPAQTARPGDPG
ncbi:MAG: GNAT family N-acetyltransferase [Micromonosporaceae bacterium]